MTTATCPKCQGKGRIDSFGHYAKGVCFGCAGAGSVKIAKSAKRAESARPSHKEIKTTIGNMAITRHGSGFMARIAIASLDAETDRRENAWDGCAWFDVVAGKVRNVELSSAVKRFTSAREIREALQGAYRGP